MKSILIPVDGSDSALNALKAAQSMLYAPHDLCLKVIAVQPPILSGNVRRYISAEALDEYYQEEGNSALAQARALYGDIATPISFEVLVGPVAETIVEYAQQQDCIHIVMGRRGLGLVKGLLLGSVTTKVLNLTDLPVTLVK